MYIDDEILTFVKNGVEQIKNVSVAIIGCLDATIDVNTMGANNKQNNGITNYELVNTERKLLTMTHYKKHKFYKRKDGRWQITFTHNKKKYYVYGHTQKECCSNYESKLEEIKKGKTTKMLFFSGVDYYLENYASELKSYKTLNNLAKNYIYKLFTNKDINTITAMEIDKILSTMQNSRTKQYVYQFLHKILKTAYRKQILKQDISEFIEPIYYKSKKGKAITIENMQIIFDACKDKDVKNLLKFYYLTGVRKSEAFMISTADIDWNKNVIHIPGTKREKSNRYIPMFDSLAKLFSDMGISKHSENKKIFEISDRKTKQTLYQIKKDTSIDFSIKDFRTSFATRCFEIGINEKILQEWMGHAQSSTTKDYYVFVQDDLRKENKVKFDNYFDNYFN